MGKRPVLAITMGDAAGIGAEIIIKALENEEIYNLCVPVVVGDYEAMADAATFTSSSMDIKRILSPEEAEGKPGIVEMIDLALLQRKGWKYKKVSSTTGNASYQYIVKAIHLAQDNRVHAVVTGPINKEAINAAGHHFAGHTEIFAYHTLARSCAMLLMSEDLKVIHCTTHVSMREACDRITYERVQEVIRLADEALKLMGVKKPKIGVAGLNAHCSENGLFGTEEEEVIIPAIQHARKEGYQVEGPIPPDTVFVKAMAKQYDIVVAMYHDQGHIPIKLSGFKLNLKTNKYESMSGVNITVGLPVIRTSVDHGTAFGKAGEGRANEESMVEAIEVAALMAKHKFPDLVEEI